jgi:hypothetical protein
MTDAPISVDGTALADAAFDGVNGCIPSVPLAGLLCCADDGGAAFAGCSGNQLTCPDGFSLCDCAGDIDNFQCTDVCGSDVIGNLTCGTTGWICPRDQSVQTTLCVNGCLNAPSPPREPCCDTSGKIVDFECTNGDVVCSAGSALCNCPLVTDVPWCCGPAGGTLSNPSCVSGASWQCLAGEVLEETCCSSAGVNYGLGSATCKRGGWSCGGTDESICTDSGP